MKLYHGSSMAIEHPNVAFNTGFSDLGRGFYLTDDLDVARARALSRARLDNAASGIVSVFEFGEQALNWASWGENAPSLSEGASQNPFGLRFESTQEGIAAWANYIKACRKGSTEVPSLGDPAIVRAWIANEDIEMVCSGFAPAEALAEFIDPTELTVQYCFRDQKVLDQLLVFVESRTYTAQ